MSDNQDLLNLMDEIKAVPKENLQSCNMPISIFLGEVEGLHTRATKDLTQLTAVGMNAEMLPRMLSLAGALRSAQSNWEELITARQEAGEVWKEAAPGMYDLRNELIAHMDFAYRKNDLLLEKLAEIKEGDSHADAIQDLSNLSVLGKNNPEPLTAINFDLTRLDQAAEMANRMAGLLGAVDGHMYADDETKIIRDQAYTLLKEIVDEVRDYGKFVFRNDEKLRRSYSSKYTRNRNSQYRKNKQNQEVDSTIEVE